MPSVQDNVSALLGVVRGFLQDRLNEVQTWDLNRVLIGNIARADSLGTATDGTEHALTDAVVLTLVRTEEDPTRKNQRNYRANPLATDASDGILYRNPPVGLNLYLLITANHQSYANALDILSNVIAVFQQRKNLTDDGVVAWPAGVLFGERSLKFNLLSPTFEEENHLWSMLGGKQLPSVLYMVQTANVEMVPDQPTVGPPINQITLNESIY